MSYNSSYDIVSVAPQTNPYTSIWEKTQALSLVLISSVKTIILKLKKRNGIHWYMTLYMYDLNKKLSSTYLTYIKVNKLIGVTYICFGGLLWCLFVDNGWAVTRGCWWWIVDSYRKIKQSQFLYADRSTPNVVFHFQDFLLSK